MNKEVLMQDLNALIAQDRPPEAQIFLRLLQQVWGIDWTVAPYDVFIHYIEWDVPYFYRFMHMDFGDEAEEDRLLHDWFSSQMSISNSDKTALFHAIEEANEVRYKASQS
ncbi:MAG: hypothetical protein J7642_12510 [Cyanobacteria bacterium SBC]|nr:hypothetical protein [Cyanobacteria bacterium SBC]